LNFFIGQTQNQLAANTWHNTQWHHNGNITSRVSSVDKHGVVWLLTQKEPCNGTITETKQHKYSSSYNLM